MGPEDAEAEGEDCELLSRSDSSSFEEQAPASAATRMALKKHLAFTREEYGRLVPFGRGITTLGATKNLVVGGDSKGQNQLTERGGCHEYGGDRDVGPGAG